MKKIDKKTLFITIMICILPILLGLAFYNSLPDKIAFHFDVNNQPDSYGSKNFVLFFFPVLMVLFQVFVCTICDIVTDAGSFYKTKLGKFVKWIIPLITVVLYAAFIAYAMGNDLDMRKFAFFIVGICMVLIGNYLPKMPFSVARESIHPHGLVKDEKSWGKTSRIVSIVLIIIGFLFLLGIFI